MSQNGQTHFKNLAAMQEYQENLSLISSIVLRKLSLRQKNRFQHFLKFSGGVEIEN